MNAPHNSPSLYALASSFLALSDLLEELDEAGTPTADVAATVQKWIEELDGHAAVKLEAVGRFIVQQQVEAAAAIGALEAAEAEMQRLRKRVAVSGNKVKRLKEGVLLLMQTMGQPAVKTQTFTFTETKNGGKLPLTVDDVDPMTVGPDLTTTIINHDAVRARLEAGQRLAWARLADRGTHLRIK